MGVAIGLAFVAGLITAISPCVLPVLPIVLAGGASGGRRRPYAIIAGLASPSSSRSCSRPGSSTSSASRTTCCGTSRSRLLFVIAATLIFPQVGVWIERPLSRLSRRPSSDLGGGFLLGCALGFVFVPCGGPAIAFVTSSSAASTDFGFKTFAVADRLHARRLHRPARDRARRAARLAPHPRGRRAVPRRLRRRDRGGRVRARLQPRHEAADLAARLDGRAPAEHRGEHVRPGRVRARPEPGRRGRSRRPRRAASPTTGRRRSSAASSSGSTPSRRRWPALRGKVVLIDFWTYSCINCLRTLPHLKAWWATYHPKGLVIVGVHTPEFAFEHDSGNVREAVQRLGVKYPVALDGDYGTWNAWSNQYWPAEYLIDRNGHVRHAHFGEGEYDKTEQLIRRLLISAGERDAGRIAPVRSDSRPSRRARRATSASSGSSATPGRRSRPGAESVVHLPEVTGPERARLRRALARERREHRQRQGRRAALQLRRQERLPRARRQGPRSGAGGRKAGASRARVRA